jgi:hypothetical protein
MAASLGDACPTGLVKRAPQLQAQLQQLHQVWGAHAGSPSATGRRAVELTFAKPSAEHDSTRSACSGLNFTAHTQWWCSAASVTGGDWPPALQL